ncbi:MAG: DegT/DnrJ/EryC1/StrS family aminotransferase [Bacteroidota bacterium]|nr:DegT/DnrJ/EryC1/StrS family aminotransferase [Bacteroidota bacterium]
MRRISYTKPSITSLEIDYATDAAKNGWGSKCYEYINRFEESFKKHLDVGYCIATSSCTGALHMGLHALNIGSGDEVILANTNWVATAAPIIHLGATPVFVDILEKSWCIDPENVRKAINLKTKAIIVTHLYGNLCEMNSLLSIGKEYNIPIIEDSAEAIGSIYKGKKAGSMGLFGAFSFHGTKTITTGEGGIFVTNDKLLFEKVLTLSNHGRCSKQTKQFWPDMIGFKYKMSNIQAAIGLGQLERLNYLLKKKREIFNSYKNLLSDLPLTMNPEDDDCINGYWMPTIVFKKDFEIQKDNLIKYLNSQNIDARVFFWPLSHTPIKGKKAFENKEYLSEEIHLRSLNLPSSFDLTNTDIKFVCDSIRYYLMKLNSV